MFVCGQTHLLKTLPFLAIIALIAVEVFVGWQINSISQALEEHANARTLDSAALKEISAKAGPEVKSLLAPFFLALAALESEKATSSDREKDLQRWRARTAEIQQVKQNFADEESKAARAFARDGQTLVGTQSFNELAAEVIEAMYSQNKDSIIATVFVRSSQKGFSKSASYPKSEELEESVLKVFNVAGSPLAAVHGNFIDVGPLSLKRYGLEEIAENSKFKRAVVFPVESNGRTAGAAICFSGQEAAYDPNELKRLEKFGRQMAAGLLSFADKESEQERHNTDQLTGLRSRSYFNDLLTKLDLMVAACKAPAKPTVMIIAIDLHLPDFVGTTEDTIEKWLPQLARCISQALTSSQESNELASMHACRYQKNQIAILLEAAEPTEIESLSKAINERIKAHKNWAGEREEMSVSIGVTPCSAGQDAEAVLNRGLLALDYAQEAMRAGHCVFSHQVPPNFQPQKNAVIDGELGVLDSYSLLQSIAASAKTGILTVTNSSGNAFVSTWDNGKLVHTKLENSSGMDAFTEFVIFFNTGHFHFQQMNELPLIDHSQGKTPPLSTALMEACLAADHFTVAKAELPELKVNAIAVNSDTGWQSALLDVDISSREMKVMKTLFAKLSSQPQVLEDLMIDLGQYPQFLKWRAANLLKLHGLMRIL
ncbi:diguanylate cyclase [bacterium]|nr:diguanylate cyclase [bacterium]